MAARLAVLGPTRVQVDGVEHRDRSTLKRRMLARLALAREEPVSTDRLIVAVWGDDAPRTAAQALYVHISQLRDRLHRLGVDDVIETAPDGYRFTDTVHIDAHEFDRLAQAGLGAIGDGDVELGLAHLRDAAELWAEPYVDLEDDPAAVVERHRLAALHDQIVDELHDHALADGGAPPPSLIALVASEPLRERPHLQLARARRAAGDLGAASQVLSHARRLFERELGTCPQGLVEDAVEAATADADADRVWRLVEANLGRGVAVIAGADADLASFMDGLARLADDALRPFVATAMPPGTARPLALVDRLTTEPQLRLHHQPDRLTRHRTTTHRLEREVGRGGVIVIDHAERLDQASVDHLISMLSGSRRAQVTTVLVLRGGPRSDLVDACVATVPLRERPIARRGRERLGPSADAVVRVLAHAVLPAPVEVIVRAVALPAGECLRAIDALTARGILTLDAASRVELLDELPDAPASDTALHQALAEAVAATLDEDDPYRIVAEARHRVAADEGDDAPSVSTLDALRRAAAYLDALDAQHELAEIVDAIADVERHDLDLGVTLARAAVRAGTPGAAATLDRVLTEARSQGQPAAFADAVRAGCEQRAPQTIDAATRALIAEALAPEPGASTETRVQLLTDLAGSWYLSDPERCESIADEALAVARSAGDDGLVARALTGLIQSRWGPDTLDLRLEMARDAQERARRSGSIETQLLALTYEAAAHVERGHLADARPPLAYAEALATAIQVPRFRWWVAAWQAVTVFAAGRLDEAEAAFDRALALWPTSERSDAFECYVSQIAAHRMLTGRSGEIARAAADVAERSESPGVYRAVAAAAHAMAGDLERARALLRPYVVDGLPTRRDATFVTAIVMTAEAAWLTGTTALAPALRTALEPLVDQHAVINVWGGGGFYWGSVRHASALALALDGEVGEARRQMLRASREQHDGGVIAFAERSRETVAALG